MLAVTGMFGTFLFLTYLLQTIDHYSPLKTGVAFLPLMALNGLAATQLASRLMPHVRTRLLVVPGLLLAALGVALFTQLTPDASYVTHVLPSELLLGLGLGLAIVPCISTATQNADPKDVGRDLGHDQHVAADRGLHRHRPAEHDRRDGHRDLSGLPPRADPHLVADATVHGYADGERVGGRDPRAGGGPRRRPHQRPPGPASGGPADNSVGGDDDAGPASPEQAAVGPRAVGGS